MEIKKSDNYYIIKDTTGSYYFCDARKDAKEPLWKLFWYVGPGDDKHIEIESNINYNGFYTSIYVTQEKYSRHFGIIPESQELSCDVIELRNNDERILPEKDYISFRYSIRNPKIKIEDYLKKEHIFVTYDEEKYEGVLTSNKYIIDFIKADKELSPIIDDYHKQQTKTKNN